MDDFITIVDENDQVVGSADRNKAYLKGLWHRIVVILVFNSQGQIYIQKRPTDADTSPNLWDHSAAGHVDKDEEPELAAKRELFEELGIKAYSLQFIAILKTQRKEVNKTFNRFWYIYQCQYDGKMHLQSKEVSSGKFVDVEWLKEDLELNPDKYTDGVKSSFKAYLESSK